MRCTKWAGRRSHRVSHRHRSQQSRHAPRRGRSRPTFHPHRCRGSSRSSHHHSRRRGRSSRRRDPCSPPARSPAMWLGTPSGQPRTRSLRRRVWSQSRRSHLSDGRISHPPLGRWEGTLRCPLAPPNLGRIRISHRRSGFLRRTASRPHSLGGPRRCGEQGRGWTR